MTLQIFYVNTKYSSYILPNYRLWKTTYDMYLQCSFFKKYTGLQVLEHEKQWRIIKSACPCLVLINGDLLCGARTVGLVIRGLYAISCLNTDGGVPSFCFPVDLVFQERASMLHTQVCWSVNFCVCILPVHKIVMNIISTQCMHILLWLECDGIIFRVLTFC